MQAAVLVEMDKNVTDVAMNKSIFNSSPAVHPAAVPFISSLLPLAPNITHLQN